MRDITFRGMDIMGVWHYGLLCIISAKSWTYDEGTYISNNVGMPMAYKVRPETAGQYTGRHDKKGIPIYEGDILCIEDEIVADVIDGHNRYEPENHIVAVDFGEEGSFGTRLGHFYQMLQDYGESTDTWEVIGNIYQHPHLLQ